jgi:hypothetical protein
MTSFTGPPLNLQALSELLESNYFDPVLWSLYYTCSYFYNKKPRDLGKREIRIRNYRDSNVYKLCEELKRVVVEENLLWLKGDSSALRDILIYDKAKPWYALMGVATSPHIADAGDDDDDDDKGHKTFYIIPAEWLPYIYVRRHKNDEWSMYLAKNKFCCRQVLVRGSVTVARRDNISIDERYCKAENYFHVGVGECKAEIHDVLADVGIFINGGQLYDRTKLIAEPYGKVREVIYALSVREKIFKFGDEDLISGKFLRAIMKHLLVCRLCNMYVDKLIEMICNVLVKYAPLSTIMESNDSADKIIDGAVPCYSYILDGDFVIMRRDAFNAALKALPKDKRKGVWNICQEIILPFSEKYNVVNMLHTV